MLAIIISEQVKNEPEDKYLSSGHSIVWENMGKIYNYGKFHFVNKIDIYELPDENQKQSNEEYPQGLCMTQDYVFVSLYSDGRGKLGKIKVFDKKSGKLLLILGMDENSHLGGLAFDGEAIWACNPSKMALERISYSLIQKLIQEKQGKMIDVRNLVEVYRVKNVPSCVTYNDGMLWVATHSIWSNSTMIAYKYEEEKNKLEVQDNFRIPPKVQGVAFSERGEVYLSISYGRRNSSFIKKYKSLHTMSNDVRAYAMLIELPPCSEEIVYENGRLYVLFESAGKKFLTGMDGKGKSLFPIDRIIWIQ